MIYVTPEYDSIDPNTGRFRRWRRVSYFWEGTDVICTHNYVIVENVLRRVIGRLTAKIARDPNCSDSLILPRLANSDVAVIQNQYPVYP